MDELDFFGAPKFSREASFKVALNKLHEVSKNPNIVEIGSTRQKDDLGAGNSSELFAWYVTRYGGKFTSCDINQRNSMVCKGIVHPYFKQNPRNINIITDNGVTFLKSLMRSPNLLYLDSMDCSPDDYMESAEHHVELFKSVENILEPGNLILIDDIYDINTFVGKGYLIIPYLLNVKKYECLYRGYQFLFQV